jgi:signal transduction histidine kinase/CheY-like chemotaxis protein
MTTESSLRASLVDIGGGSIYPIGETTGIGRDPSSNVRLDDMMVAKKHAEIRRSGNDYVLVDLGSRHGTYVGGNRVTGEVALRHGDEILIAGTRFRFDLQQIQHKRSSSDSAISAVDGASPLVMRRLSAWAAQRLVPASDLAGLDALTRAHEKLRALLELTRALGVEHDPRQLAERLLENIFGLVTAERGVFVVIDPKTDGLGWSVSRHRSGGREKIAVPRALIQEVMAQASGVLTVDAELDARFSRSQSIASAGIRSAMCVPLMYRGPTDLAAATGRSGELLGVIYVDCRDAVGAFDDDDLELLTSLGGQAALALKNALLVHEVQEREAAERRRLEQVIGNMPAAVIVLDRDRKITLVNPEGERLLPALGPARAGDALAQVRAEPLAVLLDRVGDGAGDVSVGDRTYTVTVSAGDGGLVVLAMRDVTEERAQRARDAHEERLALLGRVAGGIAHDFNNLLAVIVNYTDFARERGGNDPQLREDLDNVREAASRASALTRQLLAFGRREPIRPQVVDLNSHVAAVDRMLRRTLGANISVRLELAGDLPQITIDPTQLEQVIANLVVNARDALSRGGELAISTGGAQVDVAEARRLAIGAGRYAELIVADTGTGMSREVLARIFEPFFTTKDKLHGTGLGLATVHGIVKRASGAIVVESTVGVGSQFRVLLPATTEVAAAPPVDPMTAAARRQATIVVAEDQAPVLQVIQRILGRAGYRLLTATCGADALQQVGDFAEPIDMLVTDMIMPGMSGRELADQLRVARPGIKVLYISGHLPDNERDVMSEQTFLAKPFTSRELLDRVGEILGPESMPAAAG